MLTFGKEFTVRAIGMVLGNGRVCSGVTEYYYPIDILQKDLLIASFNAPTATFAHLMIYCNTI